MAVKRITYNPIDIIDGFFLDNVGSTVVEDPAWETLFSVTALQIPKGFYLGLYELTVQNDTINKPVEARIVGNGDPSTIYHAVMTSTNEVETALIMYFFSNDEVKDVFIEFQFRNGLGGGGGATLTVDRIELLILQMAKRPTPLQFFENPSQAISPLPSIEL